MRRALTIALMSLALPSLAPADEMGPVRSAKCPALGVGVIWVQDKSAGPVIGDPNGGSGPWVVPPLPPFTVGAPPESLPGDPTAAKLAHPLVSLVWRLGATADFDGDGLCDLVWMERPNDDRHALRQVALTRGRIDGDSGLPVFREPTPEDTVAALPQTWTLVGSGDLAGASEGVSPAPPDQRPDLLFWNEQRQELAVWVSDEAGRFPAGQRYVIAWGQPGWEPVAVANLDGEGAAEVIRQEAGGQRLAYSRIVADGEGLNAAAGGPFQPEQPAGGGWTLRAADDIDGNGLDDLIFQNWCSEKTVVWYIEWFPDGPHRRDGKFFIPDRLANPNSPGPDCAAPGSEAWVIIGPR